jgi:hypothetical protein
MKIVVDTAFLIECLNSFTTPNSNKYLNAQEQRVFKRPAAVGI